MLRRIPEDNRPQLPTPARALMRTLLIDEVARAVDGLEGHVRTRRADQKGWADVELMARAACTFAGKGTEHDDIQRAAELLCKVRMDEEFSERTAAELGNGLIVLQIQTNAIHRYELDLGQVGIYLEPTLAMANHSCIPNALVFSRRDKPFCGPRCPSQLVMRLRSPIQVRKPIDPHIENSRIILSGHSVLLVELNF